MQCVHVTPNLWTSMRDRPSRGPSRSGKPQKAFVCGNDLWIPDLRPVFIKTTIIAYVERSVVVKTGMSDNETKTQATLIVCYRSCLFASAMRTRLCKQVNHLNRSADDYRQFSHKTLLFVYDGINESTSPNCDD